ncbi:glycosyltransferase family protein [Arcticibacter svalbardensis]|nr:oligosaccharide biosynthesis protein Alg14 [Arcticibacter svalbardensis]
MKIIGIASVGGHWVQLLRVVMAFKKEELIFISTSPDFAVTVPGKKFYHIADGSSWNKFKLLRSFWNAYNIVMKEKPDVIVTTGAAPGLMGLFAGKILGAKTIWIDSIANVEKISLSGRIALWFADRVYTQWPDLASSKVTYAGNVLI